MNLRGKLIDLSRPKVMGILNTTPDSFYDGGKFTNPDSIRLHVKNMLNAGATFIDVGGYSSRPGATDISEKEELQRVMPVVELLIREFPDALVSIDTFRSSIAKRAIAAGASIINDISGGELDAKMFETVASLKVPYILMHMRGTPQTMKGLTQYDDLIKEMTLYFSDKIQQLQQLGVTDVIIDPGFGFAKTIEQSFDVLHHLDLFQMLGKPILAGLSRKSMIWKTLGTDVAGALNGTTALNSIALSKGAGILRVHDVKETVECVRLFEKMYMP